MLDISTLLDTNPQLRDWLAAQLERAYSEGYEAAEEDRDLDDLITQPVVRKYSTNH